jgi:cytochrome c553
VPPSIANAGRAVGTRGRRSRLRCSPDDIRDVAAYYAGVESPFPALPRGNAQLVDKGRALAESGNATKDVPACNACHGAGGAGEAPTIPNLAGQYASYTASQLQNWRKGSRRSSLEAMRLFVTKLDDQDIDAVAGYYQQARTPSVAAATATAPAKH